MFASIPTALARWSACQHNGSGCAYYAYRNLGTVQCQAERSQHKNREKAWSMLRARLYENELKSASKATDAATREQTEIGWGHQIRSYVLQPYQLVKDLRTGVESTNPQEVLDGAGNAVYGSSACSPHPWWG